MPLPPVAGTVVRDIDPVAFPPGTKVDGTALTFANSGLTPVGSSPIYKEPVFSSGAPSIRVALGVSGFSVPRPVQDDFTIYVVVQGMVGQGSGANFYQNGAFVDSEAGGVTNDFSINLRADGAISAGTGNPDTTGTGTTGRVIGLGAHIVSITRKKSTGVLKVYIDGVLDVTVTNNTNSLNASANIYFGRGSSIGSVGGDYGRIVFYDATHSDADRTSVESYLLSLYTVDDRILVATVALHTLSGNKSNSATVSDIAMHTAIGAAVNEEWVSAVGMHTLRGGRAEMAAVDMLVMHTIVGPELLPPPPPDTTTGPEPEVLPPDDCTDEGDQPEGCCVPEVNGLIETRVGPLNSIADIRAAIWYLQDRQNVLVREWNKLAAVTRTNFPRV